MCTKENSDYSTNGAFCLNTNFTHENNGALTWCMKIAEGQSRDGFGVLRYRVDMKKLKRLQDKKYDS